MANQKFKICVRERLRREKEITKELNKLKRDIGSEAEEKTRKDKEKKIANICLLNEFEKFESRICHYNSNPGRIVIPAEQLILLSEDDRNWWCYGHGAHLTNNERELWCNTKGIDYYVLNTTRLF